MLAGGSAGARVDTIRTADELVPFQVAGAALFQIDVAFVEEEDGVPLVGLVEDLGELAFDGGGGYA